MKEFKIEDLLFKELVLTDQEASDYEELITKIGEIAYDKGYVTKEFSQGVIEREKLYPTGLPTNIVKVAIPHSMIQDHVNKSAIIVSKLDKPVNFKEMGSLDENYIAAELVFLLAVNGTKDQLKILQDLIGLFSNEEAMNKLKNTNNSQELFETLKSSLSK